MVSNRPIFFALCGVEFQDWCLAVSREDTEVEKSARSSFMSSQKGVVYKFKNKFDFPLLMESVCAQWCLLAERYVSFKRKESTCLFK